MAMNRFMSDRPVHKNPAEAPPPPSRNGVSAFVLKIQYRKCVDVDHIAVYVGEGPEDQ